MCHVNVCYVQCFLENENKSFRPKKSLKEEEEKIDGRKYKVCLNQIKL